jgi:hypothetical protein
MIKEWLHRISKIPYVQRAISDQADLSIFKQQPSARAIWGLITIGISYTIGWPLISVLGLLSLYWEKPLLLIIGGPVAYGLSHLVFILGAYLAGADYAKDFLRWATRAGMEKLLGAHRPPNKE